MEAFKSGILYYKIFHASCGEGAIVFPLLLNQISNR